MPKLQCKVSGLWYAVTTNHKKELVEKFEAEGLNLESDYVSRDARRLLKEGKSESEIREMAENGEIATKTTPPKRARKANATAVPTPRVATKVDTSETPAADTSVDPDIDGFMQGEIPEGDASNKAV